MAVRRRRTISRTEHRAAARTGAATPTSRHRDKCGKLTAYNHVPYVNLVSQARLPDSSFYDLWHLVEQAREVRQDLPSAETAALLERYGYGGGS